MKCLIWGTGKYCSGKIDYLTDIQIVGFVDRTRFKFRGFNTILPNEIGGIEYDKLIVFSFSFIDIIHELIEFLGVSADKIIPGICIKPLLPNELELMDEHSAIEVNNTGGLDYYYDNHFVISIRSKNDFEIIKHYICDENNSGIISTLSLKPVSKLFGLTRGGSIARYYIDKFISSNGSFIEGHVLEVGDNRYSKLYGSTISESSVLCFDEKKTGSVERDKEYLRVYGDLRDGNGIPDDYYDCIVMTQVLNFISDIKGVSGIIKRKLKMNGRALITVSGISPISRFDMERWGHYVGFTQKGLMQLFNDKNMSVKTRQYGNCKTACAFLQGMSYKELEEEELDYFDEDFPIIITALIQKKGDC